MTPGGPSVPAALDGPTVGADFDVGDRVKALVGMLSQQLYNYVAQACCGVKCGWQGQGCWNRVACVPVARFPHHAGPPTAHPPPSQGLFERHKLLVATQLCMRILHKQGELSQEKFEYLLRGPKVQIQRGLLNIHNKVAGSCGVSVAGVATS